MLGLYIKSWGSRGTEMSANADLITVVTYVLRFGETTSHLTSKWRGTFQYFQSHVKIPYIYYLEKPPPI